MHRLHVVQAKAEVDIERWSQLIAVLRKEIEATRKHQSFRIADRNRSLGQEAGKVICQRSHVGIDIRVNFIPWHRSVTIRPLPSHEVIAADRMPVVELIHLRAPEFAAHAKLLLADGPVQRVVKDAGNVLTPLRRRVTGRLKVGANVDVRCIGKRRAGHEARRGHVAEVGLGVGECLVKVVHARCDAIADRRSDGPVMAGRVVIHMDRADFKEVRVDVRRAHRRGLVALAQKRAAIDALLVVEGVIHLDYAVVAVAELRRRILNSSRLRSSQQTRRPEDFQQLRGRGIDGNSRIVSVRLTGRGVLIVEIAYCRSLVVLVRFVSRIARGDVELLLFKVGEPEGVVLPDRAAQ